MALFAAWVAGHALPESRAVMRKLTPGLALLAGLLVLPPSVAAGGWRFGVWAAGAFAFIHLVEMAGATTGGLFGDIVFETPMGWTWRGVPLIIAFNGMVMVNGAVCLARRAWSPGAGFARNLAVPLLAGLIMALFDFLIEPVAIHLEYWGWGGAGGIPFQNYVAWFLLATALTAVHPLRGSRACEMGTAGRLAGIYVALQALSFLAMNLVCRWPEG